MTLPGWRLELGAAIREARQAAGLSQEDLAGALGVRQSSVSQWERGTTAPATPHLLGLFRTLGAQLGQQLFGNEGGPELALVGRSREPCQSEPRASRGV
jgi:transcriptional regulator with XRE-family HTH domain